MTPRTFLVHGLLAGLIAGFAAFLVSYVVAEPQIDAAIALEEAGAAEHTHDTATAGQPHSHDEEAAVSRGTQSTGGLALGTVLVGIVLGGATALAAAFAAGRLGGLSARASTATVAAVGFVAAALVPFLKYPATPPAVGSGDTISERTALYFGFWALSLAAAVGAVLLARRLLPRLGAYPAVLAAAGAYLVVVVVAGAVLPTVNEVGDFPADTLWYFRLSSLMTLAATWAVLGVVLTGLVGRDADRAAERLRRQELAAAL
ncbi:CbtA family protein [Paractinoplanes brasiliensis]|uniref:Putative cobalt transporter CbtA n=1 Tax=Paractinoplanes brasiliensis TaxID=52695 RepID=A0A4R6J923_9ACTN|nr:CbtA family protein [Actinoplanes brasiliensis]TDO32104.1 putative cobalt transporter CbtA [Actinoplanes brasiliensis]GID28152.1 membrane protein [Actinoplanes brasiliensis]